MSPDTYRAGRRAAVVVAVTALVVLGSAAPVLGQASAAAAPAPSSASPPAVGTSAVGSVGTDATVSVSNHRAVITGQVQYQNRNGNLEPAENVLVILRKRTVAPTNKPIDETRTNATGHYRFEIDVPAWENGPDDSLKLRIQAVARNDAADVIRFGQNAGTANGRTYTVQHDRDIHVDSDGLTQNFEIRDHRNRRVFQLLGWLREARESIEAQTPDNWTRKQVKVKYPANVDKYRSPFNKIIFTDDDWDEVVAASGDIFHGKQTTAYHEYGHSVMGGLFGYKGWQIPKYKKAHCIWSNTGRINAWYEGFAMFMEGVVTQNQDIDGSGLEHTRWYAASRSTNADCPDSSGGQFDYDGVVVEGATANILWDLYDADNEPHDPINGSLIEVFEAVNEKDNKAWGRPFNNGRTRDIHDFFVQYADNHPDRYEALWKIYFEYGILKPDHFEHDPSPVGKSCTRLSYPCLKLDGEKWSRITPNETVQANVHSSDTDYFRIDVREEARVTVNATRTHGNSGLDVVVARSKAANPTALGTTTANGPHEEVVFTPRDTGTHYVRVTRDGGDAARYNLTVEAVPPVHQRYEQDDTRATAETLYLTPIGDHVNLSTKSAATARHDHDYYTLDLTRGDRILAANLTDGPGLSVAFEDGNTVLARAANGETLNTTTDPQGTHYFNVSGDARVHDYKLRVETQRISQLYEDNDRRATAADIEKDVNLDTRPVTRGTTRGTTRCPSSQQNSVGGASPGTPGSQQLCSRHNWRHGGTVSPGYAPHDPDWYEVTLQADERLSVGVEHTDLGVELYRGSAKVADASAGPGSKVSHYAQSAGTYYINVTGDDYVPVYDLRVFRFLKEGADRHEPNDEQSTATPVTAASSGTHTESFDLLKLAGDDRDYFSVSLDRGDSLNATLTHLESAGDVSLRVLGPLGTTDGTDPRPQVTTYTEKMQRVDLTARFGGTYYVLVAGSDRVALKYNLTVRTSSGGGLHMDRRLFDRPMVGGIIDLQRTIGQLDFQVVERTDFETVQVAPPVGPDPTPTCTLVDTRTRTRQLSVSAGQSRRITETRSFDLDRSSLCRLEATVTGPSRAEVDVYATFDGSTPSANNYALAGTNPGSTESLRATPADGLNAQTPVRVTVEGFPIAGTYEVRVDIYARE